MIAIVSHDAGGAEILSSWLSRCSEPYCLVLEGPAKSIFQRKHGHCVTESLADAIQKSDWVLCGTSWQSNVERIAIKHAKDAGKKVVAFLDHWINYQERFDEQGVFVYPDEIWVGDVEAANLAQTILKDVPVCLKTNPYYEDLQIEIESQRSNNANFLENSLLYVCEPIRGHALLQHGDERYWGYTEEEALLFFVNNISMIGSSINRIIVRPHPAERKNKYDWVKQKGSLPIVIGGEKTLVEEIVAADVVVGCESMAMVVGMLAEKRVISSIPPGGRSCVLPHAGIEHLQVLAASGQGTMYV